MTLVPQLPENAPFTSEQRAYLNGFLAGIFSRGPVTDNDAAASGNGAGVALLPLTILFASQTGNAENLAKRIAKEAGKRGFAPTVHDVAKYPVSQLAAEERLLIVASTFGDGEPPDNAKAFWDFLQHDGAPKMKATYSVCALGDSNYAKFCGFGKDLDARFEKLGARRVCARADCDVELEMLFARWLDSTLCALDAGAHLKSQISDLKGTDLGSEISILKSVPATPAASAASVAQHSRANPFDAALVTNRKLNGPGSEKETRHFEIRLEGSTLSYEAGDALAVVPSNCPELVDELLAASHFAGGESVPGRNGAVPVREAFLRHYEITKVPQPFLRVMAERTGDELLTRLTAPGVNGELSRFLWGREIIDLLLAHPEVRFTPIEFVGLLKKLNPRLYSISSSPKAHPGEVHLTVNVVRYESFGRGRKGICSTFLADRVTSETAVPVFVHTNRNFRPPADSDRPMIMVGPGTGVAPFRAFLEERQETGARGRNWLFFGDQRAAVDFMYRDELEAMRQRGVLHRLDTAFSRDQSGKVYVQHRMRERAADLYAWLEEGAHFYVCGDANRMAKDVDAMLHEVIQTASGGTVEQAREYVAKLKTEKRYQRDVY